MPTLVHTDRNTGNTVTRTLPDVYLVQSNTGRRIGVVSSLQRARNLAADPDGWLN